MVVVEQNANLAFSLVDTATVLETGRNVLTGSAAELKGMDEIRRAYRLLFADEGTLSERVEDVAGEFDDHPFVHEILDFIREGKDRAICTPRDPVSTSG